MTVYRHDVVWSRQGEIIHLKFVESLAYKFNHADKAENVVDKLRGHTILLVRTVSGKEYELSLESVLLHEKDTTSTPGEMANAITAKWAKLNSNEGV